MKKNKGFTLIELLAVIVILAIIALIAVPVVMNIISKANKSAFKDSAYGILKAGENYYMDGLLSAEGMTENVTFTFPNNIEELEFQGSKPTGGTMTVRKDGKISMAITNGKYCVTKGFEDGDVTISEDVTNCEIGTKVNTLTTLAKEYTFTKVDGSAYEEPLVTIPACIINKTKCEVGTPVAVEVAPNVIYKFYVLNDDITKNEVTLIMDRNLYSSTDAYNGNVAWINGVDYYSASAGDGSGLVSNTRGPLTVLKALKQRTSGWTNIPRFTYTLENDDDGSGGSHTYDSITKDTKFGLEESPVENVRARLPRREEINAIIGADTPWLYENLSSTGDNNTNGYWTSTAFSANIESAWSVNYNGTLSGSQLYDFSISNNGSRPVITLSK